VERLPFSVGLRANVTCCPRGLSLVTIGTSIVMIAVGAILAYALTENEVGIVNIQVVGFILIVLGIIGLILSLLYTFVWAGRRGPVEEVPVRERERTYRERL